MTEQKHEPAIRKLSEEEISGSRLIVYPKFAAIARQHLQEALRLIHEEDPRVISGSEIDRIRREVNPSLSVHNAATIAMHERGPRHERGESEACITIVFAHMALESYIYDYGIRKVGRSFFDTHIAHLRFLSKWIVTVQLATNKPFPRDGKAYQLLHGLAKLRNEIVHAKTKYLNDQGIKDKLNPAFYRDAARKAVETMDEIVSTMTELDPSEAKAVELFHDGPMPSGTRVLVSIEGRETWCDWNWQEPHDTGGLSLKPAPPPPQSPAQ